jgi:hypothetical protein
VTTAFHARRATRNDQHRAPDDDLDHRRRALDAFAVFGLMTASISARRCRMQSP